MPRPRISGRFLPTVGVAAGCPQIREQTVRDAAAAVSLEGMDPVLTTLDAALAALWEVVETLPAMRAEGIAIADATAWECDTMRRFRRRLGAWDDAMAQLAARLADECESLRVARAGRAASLAGAG